MSKRKPLARYPLPLVIDPPDTICYQIEVPNDRYHIAAFIGQIYALASASQWSNDDAHTALLVADVWWRVFNKLRTCAGERLVGGAEDGSDTMIRQNPDNPCELQSSVDGTHWCTFADLSLCVPSGAQPGSGTPMPSPGGGEQCYNASMEASNKWLLPYQVSAGDVIQTSLVSGAATDGTAAWFCPNGQSYFLGSCGGSGSTSSGDPLNTSNHMMLIAKINGVYYPAYNTSITVPSGVVNANVEFQLNDSNLADNYGNITFKACVINNGSSTWRHVFNFISSDGGWVVWDNSHDWGAWTGGIGWKTHAPSTDPYCVIKRALASRTITHLEMTFTKNDPVSAHPDYEFCTMQCGSTEVFDDYTKAAGTGTLTVAWDGSQSCTEISLHLGGHNNAVYTITQCIVEGLGVDPF